MISFCLTEIGSIQVILFHFIMQQLPGDSNAFGGPGNVTVGVDQCVDNRIFFSFCPDLHQAFSGSLGGMIVG